MPGASLASFATYGYSDSSHSVQVSRRKGAQLTDAMLQNQATQYRDLIMALSAADDLPAVVEHYSKFNASTGWVTKFKSRVIARS